MKKITIIAGARPNFMKIAPVIREIKIRKTFEYSLIHTGQHYDIEMSSIFFSELEIPEPDINLGVGSMSNTCQRARIMERLEEVFRKDKPDLVMVVGDVNSTIAAAMTAREYNIPVAHVEAGLRSFDMTMPEEINRILTDRISSFLFVTEKSGMLNLRKEGADEKNIHFVGNVMIDSLIHQMPLIEKTDIAVPEIPYMMLTLHRPSNVDNKDKLEAIIAAFREISWKTAIIFPCHPRTMKNLETHGIQAGRKIDISETGSIKTPSIYMMSPIGYNEFIKLVRHSLGVITDSGGIQEETTYMKIPCLTLRDNTERPVTMEIGTNILIGSDLELLKKSAIDIINGRAKTGEIPPLWDGKASERILDILENKFYS